MPNLYASEKKTVGGLLNTASRRIVVPEWQRNYSWDVRSVELFWQDIERFSEQYPDNYLNEQEYFLGSCVLVDSGEQFILLDGQQRLATATILLSAIRDQLRVYDRNAATRTSDKYICDVDDSTQARSYQLTLNRYDRDFFRREVQDEENPEVSRPTPAMTSHTLIRKAHHFFKDHLRKKYDELGGGQPAHDWVLRMRRVLVDHVSLVAIVSMDEDNAALVFETLNDRGITLSTPDLLRNFLLRRAQTGTRDSVIDAWEDILELGQDSSVDEFLRHFWLSAYGDVKTRSLYREMKSNLEKSSVTSLVFSEELQASSAIYRDMVNGQDEDDITAQMLQRIGILGAKALRPAVLSALAVFDIPARRKFIRSLIVAYVRHSLIGGLENSRLENVVYRIARDIRSGESVDNAIEQLREMAPNDDAFVRKFETVQATGSVARYLLIELEESKHPLGEFRVEKPTKVHIEHIYPQRPPADMRWPDHAAMVERLGNLTLLAKSLNLAARNNSFDVKKGSYGQSEFLITRDLLKFPRWDVAALEERQAKLSEVAKSVWSFE